jgi:ABC-type uncharacterized transport system auxiliary subunit
MSKHLLSLVLALTFTLLLASCTQEEVPKDLLSQEQMVPVLTDLEIAYAGVDQTVKDPNERKKKYEEMNSMVLKKHALTHDQFYASYQWYEADPMLLDTIFKQVVTKLNQELGNLRASQNAKPRAKVPELK